MIPRDEAQRIVLEQAERLPVERVPLIEAAGRIAAEPVVADRDQPPFDASAMDGFALRSADAAAPGAELRVIGEVFAGDPRPERPVGEGEAYRIMTGAPVPPGADAVVMVEHTEALGRDRVRIGREAKARANIRYRGEARRAGDTLLPAGRLIRAESVGLLATVGAAEVQVGGRCRVAVLSTGEEVVPPEATPAPHQIRNSNGPMLSALVAEAGGLPGPVLLTGDELEEIRGAVRRGLEADILVAIGGVSMGEADRVGQAFLEEGVEQIFHKVAMKPGKPIWFGRRGSTLVFGLPGNPVSSYVGFRLFVEPAMRARSGAAEVMPSLVTVSLARPLKVLRDREVWHPVTLEGDEQGWKARPVPSTGSGDLASLGEAQALVRTVAGGPPAEAGSLLPALPLPPR